MRKSKLGPPRNCQACNLCKSRKQVVQSLFTEDEQSDIMIVAESPGRMEDIKGYPLVGPAGQETGRWLEIAGIRRADCTLGNVLRCRPPGDKLPKKKSELDIMMSACGPYLDDEIEAVQPNVILALGNVAMGWLLGKSTGITKAENHGRVFFSEKYDCKIIPVIHPSAVLQEHGYMKPRAIEAFKLAKIESNHHKKILSKPMSSVKNDYKVLLTVEEVESAVHTLLKNDYISVDIETSALDFWDSKIICIQFGHAIGKAIVIPFYRRHLREMWTSRQRKKVDDAVYELLNSKDVEKVGQNFKFDAKHLKYHGFDIKGFTFDTMLAHALLYEEARGQHDLETLAQLYFPQDFSQYDEPVKQARQAYLKEVNDKRKKEGIKEKMKIADVSYADIPFDVLLPYAAMDADVTYRLKEPLEKELKEQDLTWCFDNIVVKTNKVLMVMEYEGVKVDYQLLESNTKKYAGKIKRKEKVLNKLPAVNDYLDKQHAIDVKKIREKWKGSDRIQTRVPKMKDYVEKHAPYPIFNWGSPKQLGSLLFDTLKLEIAPDAGLTEGSTDAKVIEYLAKEYKIDVLYDLLEYRGLNKYHSTYLEGLLNLVDGEDRLHTSYNQHIAVTGRLSSSAPNMQNIPVKSKYVNPSDVRNCIIPDHKNHLLIEPDFAQAEFRWWAQYSQDKGILKALEQDLDIHTVTASLAFGISMEEVTEAQRTQAKGVTFGLMFGRSAASIALEYGISQEEAERIQETFFSTYPHARRWIETTKRHALKYKFVRSFFGRVRHLPNVGSTNRRIQGEALRQAINSPIQGASSDMTCIAMGRIMRLAHKEKYDVKVRMQIHDSIILSADRTHIDDIIELAEDCMVAPYIGYEGIPTNVPMKAEFKVGEKWGEMKTYAA